MSGRTFIKIILMLVTAVAALPLGTGYSYGQEAVQLHSAQNQKHARKTAHLQQDATQPPACDGTARSGSIKGQMRSTSNCERKAAAARNAARRAAAHAVGAPGKGGMQ